MFTVLSSSWRYPVCDFFGQIIEWKLVSNPIIWLYQFWLFTVSVTFAGNCCGLKHQEYSHTFYRMTANMCIIYRMSLLTSLGTSCHKWLNCLFVRVLYWVAALHKTYRVFIIIWRKTIIWGPFYSFKSTRIIRINLMHGNTDDIPHILIWTWTDMTSSLTSHGSVNDITRQFL